MPEVKVIPVTTTGGAGAASGTASAWPGFGKRLLAVDVDYDATAPATTDITISSGGRTLLTLANANTDRTVYPRVPVQDATGTNIAGRGEEAPLLLDGELKVDVVQSNALNPAVTVRAIVG